MEVQAHSLQRATDLECFPSRSYKIAYIAVLAIVVIRGWIMPLPSGFWLDETGTYYTVSGTWAQYLDRMALSIQSPLHTAFLWLVFHFAGASEIILRLPSILSMAVAAVFVFFIARRLINASAGVLATMLFVSMPDVVLLACQARPYAACIALTLASVWFFLQWVDLRTTANSILCGITLALTVYGHPLFGVLGLVYAMFLVHLFRSGDGPPLRQIVLAAAISFGLALPIFPYYLNATKDASIHTFAGTPDFGALLSSNPYGILGGSLVLACAVTYLLGGSIKVARFDTSPFTTSFLIYWMVAPMVALFIIAKLSPAKVFFPRYYSLCLPAVAIFFALICRNIESAGTRLAVVCGSALMMVFGAWSTTLWPSLGNWREIAATLKSQNYPADTPIFVQTGYIESSSLERLTNPKYLESILAPLYTYPVPGRVVALPYNVDPRFEKYMSGALDWARLKGDPFYVIGEKWLPWFQIRLGNGWKGESLPEGIVRFTRSDGG